MSKKNGVFTSNYKTNDYSHQPASKKAPTNNPFKSEEEEFDCDPSMWVNDAEFLKNLPSSTFEAHQDDYYASYSHFGIHQEMLKDKVRTGAYRKACEMNMANIKGKIVLDIGCGTGILSIFAANAGAKHVYAVDNAHIADYAREIVKQNKLQGVITVIKGKIEEITLPVSKVDIIISEWMGYCLLYESMLDSVLYARDKWLAKDGILMPDRIIMNIAAVDDESYKIEKFGFWENIYGVNMKILKESALSEPLIDYVTADAITSNTCTFLDKDLYTLKSGDLSFANKYRVEIDRNSSFDAFVVWFDVIFSKLDNPVILSTSPYEITTHWSQSIFYVKNSFKAEEHEILEGTIAITKNKTSFRALDIVLTIYRKGKERIKHLYKLT
jgi:protein arginine N-methyltransferase 1